ncbi:MAG: CIS tube protein [Gammaproteobacteria bacterium]
MGGLAKLTIHVERAGSKLEFGDPFSVLFNPDKLVFSKTANWKKQPAKQLDCPELQFTNAEPRTLRVDLIFDTYDPENEQNKDKDVRQLYTDRIFHLTTVEKHGDKHRPPVCRLFWGSAKYFFQGVLQQLEQQFTLFTEDGIPVRAKLACTFKEWWTNYDVLNRQDLQSSDIAKMHVVRAGDTLSSIAATEYLDPKLWRPIAVENGIDDPRALAPGRVLLIPALTDRERSS